MGIHHGRIEIHRNGKADRMKFDQSTSKIPLKMSDISDIFDVIGKMTNAHIMNSLALRWNEIHILE